MEKTRNILWLSVALNTALALLLVWSTSRVRLPGLSHNISVPAKAPATRPADLYEKFPIDLANATAVVNAVYGAGKQKDANISPVGVTFIPAYLPPNTLMYHSTGKTEVPQSFEWIAMDYEFSYSFARFARHSSSLDGSHGPPGKGGPGGPKGPGDGKGGPPGGGWRGGRKTPPEDKQVVEAAEERQLEKRVPWGLGPSYMYTFRNTEALDKLIFLDGASAAKSETGEMDQQLILSKQKDLDERVNERDAAEKICAWGKPFGLQGVVRLEIGYEIVLCDFFDKVELVSNSTLHNVTELVGFPDEHPNAKGLAAERTSLIDKYQARNHFEWVMAGAIVNEGEPRILLDYSSMVTPLNKTWVDPDPYMRRINKIPQPLKDSMLSSLEHSLAKGVNPFHNTDWPHIIEHITTKFAPLLVELNSTLAVYALDPDSTYALQDAVGNMSAITYNFVRRYHDNSVADWEQKRAKALEMAVLDYVHHTFPIETELDALILTSIYRVTKELIDTVFGMFDTAKSILPDLYIAPTDEKYPQHKKALLKEQKHISTLLHNLRWSIFTRCTQTCGWDEVCFVPTWGPGPRVEGLTVWEDGSFRIPQELQCLSIDTIKRR